MHTERRLHAHEQLLFACATPWVDDDSRKAVDAALSRRDVNWPAVVTMSLRHGLAQLVAAHLRAFSGDSRIPPAVACVFARLYEGNIHRNEAHFRAVGRLVRTMESAGVEGFVLKGVALALTVYPDPALRNFADIDLLVAPGSVETARRAAQECGFVAMQTDTVGPLSKDERFELTYPEDILTATCAPEFDTSLSPEVLARYRHQIVLELHRGIFLDPAGCLRSLDLAALCAAPQTGALPDGTRFKLFAWESMLVHLAHHAACHLFGRLIFPVDMAAILRLHGQSVDWDRVTDLAARYEVADNVYHALALVRARFEAHVPDDALEMLRRQAGPHRSSAVISLPGVFDAVQVSFGETLWRRWLTTHNGPQRAVAVLRLLAPPHNTMIELYGKKNRLLLGLLRVWHPFWIMMRLSVILVGLMRRKLAARTR